MANFSRQSLARRLFVFGGKVILPLVAWPVLASSYGAGIENSRWYLADSVFECSLVHEVPGYGRAVFRRRAGEQLTFFLESEMPVMRSGQGRLVVEAPAWRPGVPPRLLGAVKVSSDRRAVSLGNREARRIAGGLLEGMRPTVTQVARYDDQPVRVHLSNVNFAGPWSGYRECVSGLLPANFDQIRRSRIPFASASTNLSNADRQLLDNIATFVQADPTIERVFVDGHSDSIGSRIDNRALSEQRANAVAAYLEFRGIDESRLTVRAHGDQYPVSRRPADNRRVNVRLQREGERPEFQQAGAESNGFSG